VFLNLVPLNGMPQLIEAIADGRDDASPELQTQPLEIACRIPCVRDTERGLALSRRLLMGYLTAPVYSEYFRWLGYGDWIEGALETWGSGDRAAAAAALPMELIQEVFAVGDADSQRARIHALIRSGVSCPVLMPLLEEPSLASYCSWIESLAPDTSRPQS
jgi:alkanesulfonate monooxygenase SsuD/methylene tetrahydromethanopterin reductase-like flavin-dependent oxidoreductase (luciferase family)